jgi:hypothetical protein
MNTFLTKIKFLKPVFYLQILFYLVIKGGLNILYLIANQRVSFGQALSNYLNSDFWGDLVFGVFLMAFINYFIKSGSK